MRGKILLYNYILFRAGTAAAAGPCCPESTEAAKRNGRRESSVPEIDRENLLDALRRMPGYVAAYQIVDDSLRSLYYSPNIPAVLGLSAGEYEALIAQDACDSVYSGDLPNLREHVARCIRSDRDVYWDFSVARKRGGYIRMKCVSRIAGTLDGKPVMISSFSSAFPEREPDALKTLSADDFRHLVENIPAGVAVLRMRNGKIALLAANPALSRMVGVSQKGMKGDSADELFRRVHPEDIAVARDAISTLFSKRHGAVAVYRTMNEKTRKYIWLQAIGKSLDQPDGSQLAYISYIDITAQKKAETGLRRSRQMYELAVRGAKLTVWEYDIAARRCTCQDDAFLKAGFPSVIEDMPYSLLDHVDEKDRAAFLLMYADLENGKKAAEGEFWYRRAPSDKPRCARATYSTVFDGRGRPVKAYGIMQDITLQKLEAEKYQGMVQKMLKASSRSLCTVCLDLTANVRENGFGFIPDTASHEDGGTADEFLAAAARRVVDPKAADSFRATFNRRALMTALFAGQTELSQLYLRRMENGRESWVESLASMAQNPETGNVEAVFCVFDRTEKVKGDRLVQRLTNEEYDFIGLINIEQRLFRLINIKAGESCVLEQGVNFTEEEILRNTVAATIAPEDQDRYRQSIPLDNVLARLQTEKTYAFSFTYINSHGVRRRKQNRYCWLDDTHDELLVLRTDVTAAYQRDHEHLRLLQSALRSAENANQMRRDCLTNLSHDLRTPLNNVVGFTHLARSAASDAERENYLDKAELSAEQLQSIIKNMIDLSALESGETEFSLRSFDIRPFVNDVLSSVHEAAAKKNVWVETNTGGWTMQQICADRTSLQKVLTALLLNAIHFSEPRGHVEFTMESFVPVADGANCRFVIRDHGGGISKEFMPYLFEPFAQEEFCEDAQTAGVSLGLSVVKRLVEMMGGAIWAESEKGSGTTFTLLFRLSEPGSGLPAGRTDSLDGESLIGKKILICEDNPLNLEITQALLEQQGALVTCADNGETGLQTFTSSREGEYDAVLMDIRMPRMDGLAASRAIRALKRKDAQSVPIIAMTADLLDKNMDGLKSAGMDACLEKPFKADDLLGLLAERIKK